ncbi:MAG: hypothetical protein ACK55Z_17145, partial [bacterium]
RSSWNHQGSACAHPCAGPVAAQERGRGAQAGPIRQQASCACGASGHVSGTRRPHALHRSTRCREERGG